MTPRGKEDSRYMFSCLNIPARTYNAYTSIALIAMAYELYQGVHRTRSNGVLSLANVTKLAWEKAQPNTPDEQLALSTIVGLSYARDEKNMLIAGVLDNVQKKMGLNLIQESGVKYDPFYETAKEILKVDSDTSWVTSQAEADMEFISSPENN